MVNKHYCKKKIQNLPLRARMIENDVILIHAHNKVLVLEWPKLKHH